MKKTKVASMDMGMARTPKEAMAPKNPDAKMERSEEEKLRSGEMDLDDLIKAHGIQNDPERMEYVHKAHMKKMPAMRSIADLKMAGQALAESKKHEKMEEVMGEKEDDMEEKKVPAQPRHKARYPKR